MSLIAGERSGGDGGPARWRGAAVADAQPPRHPRPARAAPGQAEGAAERCVLETLPSCIRRAGCADAAIRPLLCPPCACAGLSFHTFLQECAGEALTFNDTSFKSHLRELLDHALVEKYSAEGQVRCAFGVVRVCPLPRAVLSWNCLRVLFRFACLLPVLSELARARCCRRTFTAFRWRWRSTRSAARSWSSPSSSRETPRTQRPRSPGSGGGCRAGQGSRAYELLMLGDVKPRTGKRISFFHRERPSSSPQIIACIK